MSCWVSSLPQGDAKQRSLGLKGSAPLPVQTRKQAQTGTKHTRFPDERPGRRQPISAQKRVEPSIV